MTKLSLLFVSSLLLTLGCAQVQIPDISPRIVLPGSGDCYTIKMVSHVERRIPKAQCALENRKGIILISDDWALLKYTLLKNCFSNECTSAAGALDDLFHALDKPLKGMP